MARAALSVQSTARTGLKPVYTAATVDGHAFNNVGRDVIFHVKNGGASAVTVTFDVAKMADGLAISDLTVSVPAGEDRMVGPFTALYEQENVALSIEQAVHVNTSAQASITYAAIKLGAS